VLIAGLLMLTGVLFDQDPTNDVASCYARQVREFAAGNWPGAFHHMTPPLVIVLGGMIAKLGIPPFAALKIVSGLFFIAGLWPLSRILRRMAPASLAGWGCLLYAVSPRLVRYAAVGLLDSVKLFFLLWLVDQLLAYAEEQKTRPACWLGVAAGGLALARGEGIFFLPLVLAGMLLLPWFKPCPPVTGGPSRLTRAIRSIWQGILVVGIAGLLCLPQILYIQSTTGYPALDSRQTKRVQIMLGKWFPSRATQFTARVPDTPTQVLGRPRTDIPPEDVITPWRNFREAVKGLDHFLLALAALGLAWKLRRRQWCAADVLCAGIIAYNIVLFAVNGFITKRYTAVTAPFLLAWSVQGAAFLKVDLFDRFHRRLFPIAAVGVILGFAVNSAKNLVKLDNPPRQFARWLAPHRSAFIKPSPIRLVSDPHGKEYHDGRQPLIAATTAQYSFWAKADWVGIPHRRWFTPDEVRLLLCRRQADLLVVDADLRGVCPSLDPDRVAWLEQVAGTPAGAPWALYRVRCEQEPLIPDFAVGATVPLRHTARQACVLQPAAKSGI